MSVVDFHLHLFSRPFFEALAAQSPLPGTPEERLARVAERTGIELPPADLERHVARWLSELDAHGVEHVAAFASAPEEVPALAEAARLADGRLTPMAVVDPTVPGCADKVRALVRERGFGGVLLFPAMHRYDIGGPAAAELVAALDELRAVAYVHCGMLVVKLRDLLGLPRPFDLAFADPLAVVPAANRAPNAHFVVPHFGAGFLRETLMAGSLCENVYVDTSSSNSWRATQTTPLSLQDVFARALDVFGPDRILFGTDSNVFPAGWRAERLEEQVAVLDALGLGDADRGLILAGNARRLLPRA